MQMFATGVIGSVAEGRDLVRQSVDVVEYQPQNVQEWDDAYLKYQQILRRESC